MGLRVFAPYHGFSQLVTSFFASGSLGILHVPFAPFLFLLFLARVLFFLIRVTNQQKSFPIFSLFCPQIFSFELRFFLVPIMSMYASFLLDMISLTEHVENNGFEPLTPCLQSRCSSQLS